MWPLAFTISLLLTSLLISALALGLAAWALINYVAKEKSTHSIQYVPLDLDQSEKEQQILEDKQIADALDNIM